MKVVKSFALAGLLGLAAFSGARAQSTSLDPSVPNPANPYPLNPVASDGTPLPRFNGTAGAVYSGRSAYAPGGLVGTGVGVAGAAVDTGLGVADTAVDGFTR